MATRFSVPCAIIGGILAIGVSASPCSAQYWRYPYRGGGNAYYNPLGGPGGFMYGTASVINATGNLWVNEQQARVVQQQAEQARLDTKKKAFDETMYERANTPTYTEDATYKKNLLLNRILNTPTPAEIARGDTLNMMLPVIKDLSAKGATGPPIQLDPDLLRQINVSSGVLSSNFGILKDGGKVDWPLPVRGPKQEKLAALLPEVVAKTASGNLDLALYQEAVKETTGLQDDLRKRFYKEEIDGGTYLIGKRFLDSLAQSVKGLQEPGAQRALNGSYAARGNNVPELVNNMISKGLKFAPAIPGDEPAYNALNDAFTTYTTTAMANAGIQIRFNPPRTDAWVKNK